ncbi:MAG: polysaccharide deacetylase family protein [Bacteroidales bacterium]|nr:polysaccharide deacetylase family protein [Bacteroidales bacterium]
MLIAIIVILVAICAVVVWGSACISSNMFVKAQCALTDKRKVLLTFDDGPDERFTIAALDALKRLNIKALFFVIGEKAAQHPDLIRLIKADGHAVGNHSYHHNPKYLFGSKNQILNELQQTNNILRENGIETAYFRPPLGVTNDALAWAIKQLKYKTIGWNIRSFDTRREPREIILSRVVRQLTGGNIVLLHDRVEHVDWLIEQIANEVHKRGLVFASAEDLDV